MTKKSLRIQLDVTLVYNTDDVSRAENYAHLSPEEYLFAMLPSFVENEIDNTNEFPAVATVQII